MDQTPHGGRRLTDLSNAAGASVPCAKLPAIQRLWRCHHIRELY